MAVHAHAPVPLLAAATASTNIHTNTIGAQIIGTIGGVAAYKGSGVAVFEPSAHLHTVPQSTPGIPLSARSAWIAAFSTHLCAACADAHTAIPTARQLEQRIYKHARDGAAIRIVLVPTAAERRRAEAVVYNDTCRRMEAALAVNGHHLMATYADVTVLPFLDDAHLEEGTDAAKYRANKELEAVVARRVLDDTDKKKAVIEGLIRCTHCKSYDVDTNMNQGRSRDEGMDIQWKCNVCGKGGVHKG